jgi:hypothetical protein
VKAFLRRAGGIDQYPAVRIEWKLHHRPELHARTRSGKNVTVDLSPLNTDSLHKFFTKHFERADVNPPKWTVRTWRRLFGWAYGVSEFEAAILFICAGAVLLLVCYGLCFRYTALCDSIQDL